MSDILMFIPLMSLPVIMLLLIRERIKLAKLKAQIQAYKSHE